MPEAEKFKALGVGNGFPYCLKKVDLTISDEGRPYDYLSTLGGNKKVSSPTDSEIALSLTNAVKLYWNFNGVTGSYNAGSATIILNIDDPEDPPYIELTPIDLGQPKDRSIKWSAAQGAAELNRTHAEIEIVKMYNGVTTDEANFVGYGVKGSIGFQADTPFLPTMYLRSFGNDPSLDPDPDYVAAVEYTTDFAGIPFYISGELLGFGDWTVSIDGLNVTFSAEPELWTDVLTLSQPDFYTYPE